MLRVTLAVLFLAVISSAAAQQTRFKFGIELSGTVSSARMTAPAGVQRVRVSLSPRPGMKTGLYYHYAVMRGKQSEIALRTGISVSYLPFRSVLHDGSVTEGTTGALTPLEFPVMVSSRISTGGNSYIRQNMGFSVTYLNSFTGSSSRLMNSSTGEQAAYSYTSEVPDELSANIFSGFAIGWEFRGRNFLDIGIAYHMGLRDVFYQNISYTVNSQGYNFRMNTTGSYASVGVAYFFQNFPFCPIWD